MRIYTHTWRRHIYIHTHIYMYRYINIYIYTHTHTHTHTHIHVYINIYRTKQGYQEWAARIGRRHGYIHAHTCTHAHRERERERQPLSSSLPPSLPPSSWAEKLPVDFFCFKTVGFSPYLGRHCLYTFWTSSGMGIYRSYTSENPPKKKISKVSALLHLLIKFTVLYILGDFWEITARDTSSCCSSKRSL